MLLIMSLSWESKPQAASGRHPLACRTARLVLEHVANAENLAAAARAEEDPTALPPDLSKQRVRPTVIEGQEVSCAAQLLRDREHGWQLACLATDCAFVPVAEQPTNG